MNVLHQPDDHILKMARNHIGLFSTVVGVEFLGLVEQVRDRTMLSLERLYDLYLSVNYVNANGVLGDILEVGTWKCGALGLALLSDETQARKVIGFDTFSGHKEPPRDELDIRGHSMHERWQELHDQGLQWAGADFAESEAFLLNVAGGKKERFALIQGDFNSTVRFFPHTNLSILRIDCDWYAESLLALRTFWPMLSSKGFLILDDFGHHPGQKKAFTEFFGAHHLKITHVDYSCVTVQKP
jgi:O-methyltransferase